MKYLANLRGFQEKTSAARYHQDDNISFSSIIAAAPALKKCVQPEIRFGIP